jgi:hypothetical protein
MALAATPVGVAAEEADSTTASARTASRSCNQWAALALGLTLPGGGQFYVRDLSGGVQAVVTDAILFEALRRSGSNARGIAFFLGSVHLVEGLFAAQQCRAMKKRRAPPAPPVPPSVETAHRANPRGVPSEREGWRIEVGIRLSLAG